MPNLNVNNVCKNDKDKDKPTRKLKGRGGSEERREVKCTGKKKLLSQLIALDSQMSSFLFNPISCQPGEGNEGNLAPPLPASSTFLLLPLSLCSLNCSRPIFRAAQMRKTPLCGPISFYLYANACSASY